MEKWINIIKENDRGKVNKNRLKVNGEIIEKS